MNPKRSCRAITLMTVLAFVTTVFSRLVKWHLGSGGVSLFSYRDRAFLRSKKAKMAISWRGGVVMHGVPRHDVTDEAGRQFDSGTLQSFTWDVSPSGDRRIGYFGDFTE
jgi:hypothetical protein